MDLNGSFARPLDESLVRELPQLQSLRIAPLRHPVSSRGLSAPSPLEPNASVVRESKAGSSGSSGPANLSSVTEFPNTTNSAVTSGTTAQTKKHDDPMSSLEPPPKPILPAFVNPRALERFPFSSFDEEAHFSRKRRRVDLHTDTFGEHLHLPIPQQQKEHRPPPFGPFAILNGLNEPPPNAALLPPIEAGSISQLLSKPSKDSVVEPALLTANNANIPDSHTGERREGRIEDILDSPIDDKMGDSDSGGVEESTIINREKASQAGSEQINNTGAGGNSNSTTEKSLEPPSPKSRGRSRKNLRKWTEEETTALLRGVVKCGIGNWTAILAQPDLKFNKRSAANLKDRFRVCCPWAYRAADSNEATKRLHDTLADVMQRSETGSGSTTGKALLPHPQPKDSETNLNIDGRISTNQSKDPFSHRGLQMMTKDIDSALNTEVSPPSSTDNVPSLSNKSKSTLASLGIPEPHYTAKPRRRSRRPFTATEDEALLKGYAVHGFQWTLIQQDERLNLGHRKATDLRDRFRTKFPHAYREGGSVSGKSLHPHNQKKASISSTSDGEKTTDQGTPSGAKRNEHSPQSPRSPRNNKDKDKTADLALHRPAPVPLQGLLENSTSSSSADASFSFHLDEPVVWDDLA